MALDEGVQQLKTFNIDGSQNKLMPPKTFGQIKCSLLVEYLFNQ